MFVYVDWNIISNILAFYFLTQKESTMNRIHLTIELPCLSDNIIELQMQNLETTMNLSLGSSP